MKTRLQHLIIGFFYIPVLLSAGIPQDITPGQAAIAARFRLIQLGKQHFTLHNEAREIKIEDRALAYVFDLVPQGYIVAGASTGLPPVLAYSFESNFGELEPSNPLYALCKADLSKRSELSNTPGFITADYYAGLWDRALNEVPGDTPRNVYEQWPATGEGWLKTNWTQSSPYNNFCPMDPVSGTRSYAGCPATAMAQIMNFHATTNNTHFDDSDDYYHNYAGRQYWVDDDHEAVDFPGFPELNEYLDTLNAHYLSGAALTTDDKAALTFACGTAAKQVYSSEGSGTFGVNQAFDAYLRFGCATVVLLDQDDEDLYDRLKQNIIDTLPAHLAVVNESWTTGHNVVVDGYNSDDYYHLNFGWGGAYNGWYLLPEEIPYELTVVEGVVVDIMMKLPTGIRPVKPGMAEARFYPNPVAGFLTIELPAGFLTQGTTLTISNLSGLQVTSREIIATQTTVDVSRLSAGLYLIRIVSGTDVITGKIVKQ